MVYSATKLTSRIASISNRNQGGGSAKKAGLISSSQFPSLISGGTASKGPWARVRRCGCAGKVYPPNHTRQTPGKSAYRTMMSIRL
jgi:hypothetical protein